MSYAEEEKQKVVHDIDVAICDSGLDVCMAELDDGRSLFWPVLLIAVGLIVVGVCILVYGV